MQLGAVHLGEEDERKHSSREIEKSNKKTLENEVTNVQVLPSHFIANALKLFGSNLASFDHPELCVIVVHS